MIYLSGFTFAYLGLAFVTGGISIYLSIIAAMCFYDTFVFPYYQVWGGITKNNTFQKILQLLTTTFLFVGLIWITPKLLNCKKELEDIFMIPVEFFDSASLSVVTNDAIVFLTILILSILIGILIEALIRLIRNRLKGTSSRQHFKYSAKVYMVFWFLLRCPMVFAILTVFYGNFIYV